MKQSLQLRLGQYLTMTPQLQQAIRLLQLSTLELQMEVQQALESNPMLESGEDDEIEGYAGAEAESNRQEREAPAEESSSSGDDFEAPVAAEERERDFESDATMPDDLPVDSVWEDVYDGATAYSRNDEGEERVFEYADTSGRSLRDHLVWQMELSRFSETDEAIAEAIIDAIDEDGYLKQSLDELHEGLADQGLEVEPDEVAAVLRRIQAMDPAGVAARDLGECLVLQLRQLPADTPWRTEAMALVGEHIELLGNRDFKTLMRRMKLAEEQLSEVLDLVRTLNPRPGSAIEQAAPQYIVPDVFVRKLKGRWVVELNPEAAPKIRVNSYYASLLGRAGGGELKGQLQEARWLIKSLQSRSETLLKVATAIVERQQAFLEQGEEAMRPLVLRDVAETVEMHESTISRITTQKFMHTPRGIFEFKYFFSSHVGTADGGEASSTAIRARIRKLIAAEEPRKPLSDNKLAKMLEGEGINVARRTVAKYREAMNIPASNERKRLQ
ncbi:RNA polymerase factor sigma-54 [Endothiovibrio diazotrophicus]